MLFKMILAGNKWKKQQLYAHKRKIKTNKNRQNKQKSSKIIKKMKEIITHGLQHLEHGRKKYKKVGL